MKIRDCIDLIENSSRIMESSFSMNPYIEEKYYRIFIHQNLNENANKISTEEIERAASLLLKPYIQIQGYSETINWIDNPSTYEMKAKDDVDMWKIIEILNAYNENKFNIYIIQATDHIKLASIELTDEFTNDKDYTRLIGS